MILSQSFDELTEEFLFSVLANLVQEKPIGKVTRIEEVSDFLTASRSNCQQGQVQPDDRESDDDQLIKHLDGSNGGQENKPEPESKVYFLVENVERKKTENIHGYHSARGTIPAEC